MKIEAKDDKNRTSNYCRTVFKKYNLHAVEISELVERGNGAKEIF